MAEATAGQAQPVDAALGEAYVVRLPLFEGPLDLLLHLIQRQELDITVISLARVADQFLAYLGSLPEVSAEVLTDFLVVAARLLLIKSRWLLPRPPVDDEEEEDPGEALARRLREYKRFKEAAAYLRGLAQRGTRSHIRVAPPPLLEKRLELGPIDLDDLIAALRQLATEQVDFQPLGPMVSARKVTVREKIDLIRTLLSAQEMVSFQDVLDGHTEPVDIVVSLWAVLELIKRGHVRAQQVELFGEIILQAQAPLAGQVA